jgi:hypothetical protein
LESKNFNTKIQTGPVNVPKRVEKKENVIITSHHLTIQSELTNSVLTPYQSNNSKQNNDAASSGNVRVIIVLQINKNVKVVCRVRPLNNKEMEMNGIVCLEFHDERTISIKSQVYTNVVFIINSRLMESLINLFLIVFLIQVQHKRKCLSMQLNQLLRV